MTYSLVASTIATPGINGGDSPVGINTTSAGLIILPAGYYNQVSDAVANTDSKGNNYTIAGSRTAGAINGASSVIYYNSAPIVGGGHTFNVTGSQSYPNFAALAYSGSASTPLDQTNGQLSTSQPGSVTPSEDNELFITIAAWNIGLDTSVPAIDSGFGIVQTANSGAANNVGMGSASKVQTSLGAENPSWSGINGNPTLAIRIATFKAAAGGGSTIKTIDGLALASIKTVNGLAIASMKTRNGLA